MTDTILPLTEADVRALGYTPFGYERDDRMGSVLAHKDGEAFYLCRRGAFWSLDPEYSNMRGVLCEEPPNWRTFRDGCLYTFGLCADYGHESYDVLVWRVSDLPVERAERLGNYHTIAPVLAGLKAQAEMTRKEDWPSGYEEEVIAAMPLGGPLTGEHKVGSYGVPIGDGIEHAPTAPAPRRPLKVGDKVITWKRGNLVTYGGAEVEVAGVRRVMDAGGAIKRQVMIGADWEWEESVSLILPDAEG